MNKMKAICSNLLISMLLVLAVLVILDGYNPAMGFLNSTVSKIFYGILFVIGLFTYQLPTVTKLSRLPAVHGLKTSYLKASWKVNVSAI